MSSRPTSLWIVKFRNRQVTQLAAYFSLDEAETSRARLLLAGGNIGDVELWACKVLS